MLFHVLEASDAEQELYLAILTAVKNMPYCKMDGQCFSYIRNRIMFKLAELCRENIKREKVEYPESVLPAMMT